MGKLEKALSEIQDMQRGGGEQSLSPLCLLLVTVVYLVAMLSVPVDSLTMLIWFAVFPIIGAGLSGLDFSGIFLKSLIALPFAALIGLFNPIFDTAPGIHAGGIEVSHGWVTFFSICLRALLSLQALLILTSSCGFIGMCRSMRRAGVPEFLTTQLQMVYRYLTVLMQESLDMRRAREARGYGKKHLSLKMWGAFVGQLFLRTLNRADNIHRAMLARGFTGQIPHYEPRRQSWRLRDTAILIISAGLFAIFRFVDLSALLGFK